MNAQTSVEPETLASAMAEAFGKIEAATKSNENAAFKQGGKVSKYADLTAVIEAIKPALIEHRLFFTQHPQPADDGVCIETVLHHANGEHMSLGSLFVPANKKDAQGFGSALTYARRYALVTAFGVPVEDDDGNAASRSRGVDNGGAKVIDDAQWATLVQLVTAAGVTAETICTAYKAPSLKELPASQFEAVVKRLNATIRNKSKQTENA